MNSAFRSVILLCMFTVSRHNAYSSCAGRVLLNSLHASILSIHSAYASTVNKYLPAKVSRQSEVKNEALT